MTDITATPAPVSKPDPSEELRKAMEEKTKIDERIEALREETRATDLAKVKELCELHGFYASDLKGSLKVKGATRTVKKSTRRRKSA